MYMTIMIITHLSGHQLSTPQERGHRPAVAAGR